ncbi:PREDICTED: zinc finger protein RFP-like [Gekko japonicus]|uniref:Zinc finger protein RFP-like n=1 Tax=Gekko japonicus TaxID=146911 RepID=A0ABM1KZI6_GEKJA|nr:PREDICTED: zinc finger protein RFP-like [Gekko japonicus]
MAGAESAWERLRAETTCPVCRDLFTEPVALGCGHRFCQACLVRCWGESPEGAVCPRCREGVPLGWQADRQLATFAEIARQSRRQQERREAGVGGVFCGKHREPLKLFCKYDGAPLCVVCGVSREHRDHAVVPAEEAAEDYKEEFCSCLDILRKGKEKILTCAEDTEQKSEDLLVGIAATGSHAFWIP